MSRELSIRVTTDEAAAVAGFKRVEDAIEGVGAKNEEGQKTLDMLARKQREATAAADTSVTSFSTLRTTLATLGIGAAVKAAIEFASQLTNLSAASGISTDRKSVV